MALIDTSLIGDGLSSLSKAFSYGHNPSVIMWSNGPSVQKEDEGLFGKAFGGIAKTMEPLVTSSAPESFNSFKFDAIVSEEHDAQSVVTKFPVSSGFMVSDHIIKQNRILKLTAVATNMQNAAMWTASVQGLSVATGAIFNNPIIPIIGAAAGAVASAFETSNRIQSTYDLFNNFRSTGTKLYISTIIGPYLNCVVTGIRTKTDKMTSAILAVEITLEELQVIGEDVLAIEARKAMQSMTDYSEFGKIAQSAGIGALGGAGVTLPGLGAVGATAVSQLGTLKDKLAKLESPLSSVKGKLFK
ncbi:hypothetical protein [Escherichia phage Ecp_YSF]|nr:hypothetical protein [Escherichia phage Ecp_YSF]